MHQFDDRIVEPATCFISFVGASDVADANLNARPRRLHIDSGQSFQSLGAIFGGRLLPLGFGLAGVGSRFFLDQFLDAVNDGIRILAGRNQELDLVPHPLAGGGEVKEVSFYGEAVDEGDAAPGGMAGIGPVAGFEKDGLEQADFNDFAAYAIDFDPIPDTNAVPSHEHEPAEEGDDEIFHRDSKACAGETENRGGLRGHAKDDEEDDKSAERLRGKFDDGAERVDALIFRRHAGEEMVDQASREVDGDENQKNPEQRFD